MAARFRFAADEMDLAWETLAEVEVSLEIQEETDWLMGVVYKMVSGAGLVSGSRSERKLRTISVARSGVGCFLLHQLEVRTQQGQTMLAGGRV